MALPAKEPTVAELKQALQDRSDQLAWLSHEIRTPMNGVLGMLECLPTEGLGDDQKEMLQVMQRSCQRLLALLAEVLAHSRLEAGKVSLLPQEFSLRQVLNDCIQLYQPEARRRQLFLGSGVAPGVPDRLRGDAQKLSQILNNLISNAVKYTDAGHVLLQVAVTLREGSDCQLRLNVRDSGQGIAAEEMGKVFVPFERTASGEATTLPSAGLGLSLTKKLVEMMGGTLGVESQVGVGSCFTCVLPFEMLADEASDETMVRPKMIRKSSSAKVNILRREPLSPLQKGAARSVLVIDDDPVNLKVAQRQLERLQISATLASSAADALELMERHTFDMVLLDCTMPQMNGYELLDLLKKHPALRPGTPLIAYTAQESAEARSLALRRGFTDFLPKPSRLEDIEKLLSSLLPAA